jgi:hypothetical protein
MTLEVGEGETLGLTDGEGLAVGVGEGLGEGVDFGSTVTLKVQLTPLYITLIC